MELFVWCRRLIHPTPELGKRAIIEQEKHLVEQNVLRLPTGRIQHETLPGTPQVIGRVIDQVTLLFLSPNVDNDRWLLSSFGHK
jgi:hypothetical protein